MENEKIDPKEAIELSDNEMLMLALYKRATKLNLGMFVFEKEDIEKYFKLKEGVDIAIVTLAKTRDNGLWNLENQRNCYIIKDYNKELNENRNKRQEN